MYTSLLANSHVLVMIIIHSADDNADNDDDSNGADHDEKK